MLDLVGGFLFKKLILDVDFNKFYFSFGCSNVKFSVFVFMFIVRIVR